MIPTIDYIRILPELVLDRLRNHRHAGGSAHLAEHNVARGRWASFAVASAPCWPSLPARYQTQLHPASPFFGMIRVDSLQRLLPRADRADRRWSSSSLRSSTWTCSAFAPANTTALILLGAVGMMLMSSAVELVLIFIALEISSIGTYILAGFRRRAAESAESSLKYFLLGSFATAFFLYGVALIFGATGSTNVYAIAQTLRARP